MVSVRNTDLTDASGFDQWIANLGSIPPSSSLCLKKAGDYCLQKIRNHPDASGTPCSLEQKWLSPLRAEYR